MKRRDIFVPLLILLIGASGFAALRASRPEPEPIEVPEKAWAVSTLEATPQRIRPSVSLFGRVESPRLSMQRAALSGARDLGRYARTPADFGGSLDLRLVARGGRRDRPPLPTKNDEFLAVAGV